MSQVPLCDILPLITIRYAETTLSLENCYLLKQTLSLTPNDTKFFPYNLKRHEQLRLVNSQF